jgi:hypothetical protein
MIVSEAIEITANQLMTSISESNDQCHLKIPAKP